LLLFFGSQEVDMGVADALSKAMLSQLANSDQLTEVVVKEVTLYLEV
jgi:hypothetical protein